MNHHYGTMDITLLFMDITMDITMNHHYEPSLWTITMDITDIIGKAILTFQT